MGNGRRDEKLGKSIGLWGLFTRFQAIPFPRACSSSLISQPPQTAAAVSFGVVLNRENKTKQGENCQPESFPIGSVKQH